MQKLLLMSIVLATFVWPALLARRANPPGFGGVLARFTGAVAVYVVLLRYVYPRLF